METPSNADDQIQRGVRESDEKPVEPEDQNCRVNSNQSDDHWVSESLASGLIFASDTPKDSKAHKRKRIRAIKEDAFSTVALNAQKEEQERLLRVNGIDEEASSSFDARGPCLNEKDSEEVSNRSQIWSQHVKQKVVRTCEDSSIVFLSSDEDSAKSSSKKRLKDENFASKSTESSKDSDSDVVCLGSEDDEEFFSSTASTSQQNCSLNDLSPSADDVLTSDGKMLVNVGHPPEDADLYIPSHLCKILKPHQLGGVRFMYNNIVESLQKYPSRSGFGCILAHSMGLGKTLQVICFADLFYRNTPGKRLLILVPINTLSNWENEFERWLPKVSEIEKTDESRDFRSFDIFVLNDKCRTAHDRFSIVEKWFEKTGVLIMGYEMFRLLTNKDLSPNKKVKRNFKPPLSQESDAVSEERRIARSREMKRMLLEVGPDLVICDEGHRIKNLQTNTAKALSCIKTKRRIVLTGYPLQNNLFEYYCMVNFVRPNYLGSKHAFANMFERPIKNGQCVDSTPVDVKLMRQRAHVLTNMLKGFVQRRSHSILMPVLPPKREFVIFLRKSPVQHALYRRFIIHCQGGTEDQTGSWNPLRTFAMCCKIWNHPDILYKIAKDRSFAERSKLMRNDLDIAELPAVPPHPSPSSVSELLRISMNICQQTDEASSWSPQSSNSQYSQQSAKDDSLDFKWADDVLEGYVPGQPENGYKMLIVFSILERSVLIGDKLLLFSQSLLSLDLIENYLCKNFIPSSTEKWLKNKSYFRLDGSTCSSDREILISRFNKESSIHLFLISTKAGSLGINLVAANRVIVLDASWNPCHDAQAVCRVYRYGQGKPTFIYRLITDNSMERMIFNRQIGKQGISDRIVDEKTVNALVSHSDLLNLLEYNESLDVLSSDWAFDKNSFEDDLLTDICQVFKKCLSQQPVLHESLLLDRGDQNLSAREKREAQRNYEREKRALHSGGVDFNCQARRFNGLSALNSRLRDELLGTSARPLKYTPMPMNLRRVDETHNYGFNSAGITVTQNGPFLPAYIGSNAEAVRIVAPHSLTLPSNQMPGTVGLIIVGEPIDVVKRTGFSTLIRTSNGHLLDASGSMFDRPLQELLLEFGPRKQQFAGYIAKHTKVGGAKKISNSSPVEITLSSDEDNFD